MMAAVPVSRNGGLVEGDQIGDADDGAGQGVVQHGDDFHRLPADELGAGDQISDDDAIESADRHADQGDDQRVLDGRQTLGEDHAVVGEG